MRRDKYNSNRQTNTACPNLPRRAGSPINTVRLCTASRTMWNTHVACFSGSRAAVPIWKIFV